MHQLTVVNQPVGALKRRPALRQHTPKQIQKIAESIQTFGFNNPILVDDQNQIIAGLGRLEAAILLGRTHVPTIQLSHMSDAEIRAYVIADNRLAELAGRDRKLLGLELQYLSELEIDLDLTVTGFEPPEIDALIAELSANDNENPDDQVPTDSSGPAVTQLGDVWQIGRHRLVCGDATQPETYGALLDNKKAQMVFTDPPYNVPIAGHVGGLGRVQHREFAMASGEMSAAEFTAFLTRVFKNLAAFSVDGSIHFQCIDWRHTGEMLAAGQAAYTELKNICVWAKTNAGMGSLYRSQHELVYVFKVGTAAHTNNVELGKYGRYRTNLWTYAGVNSFGRDREDLQLHPTVKPVALVADAIRDCSRRKDLILDAFAGSGTTLIAAERTGRCGYGIELDPAYCDVIIRRLKATCGLEAILAETGETFAAVAERRLSDPETAAGAAFGAAI